MIRETSGATGAQTGKRPRATRMEMSRRRKMVISRLESGPKSIEEIFEDADLTYPQAIGLLKMLESNCDIIKAGKRGREVIYSLASSNKQQEPYNSQLRLVVNNIHMGDSPKVVGVREMDGDFQIDLKFPTGEVVYAKLLAS